MQLGHTIATARKLKGFTQQELADHTHITVRTIQRIEADANTPQSHTLKAIARVLDLDYESLVTNNTPPVSATEPASLRHTLTLFNVSCFFFLVIPWVHYLIPGYLLRKKMQLSQDALVFSQKIIRQQIYWVVGLHLAMLSVFAFNYIIVNVKGYPQYFISYLVPFFLMYLLNTLLLLLNHRQIQKQF